MLLAATALADDGDARPPSKFELIPASPGAALRLGEPVLGHAERVGSVAVGRERVVTAGPDGLVHFWNRRTLEHEALLVLGATPSLVRLAPGGDRVAWAGRDVGVRELTPFARPWRSEVVRGATTPRPAHFLVFDAEGKDVTYGDDHEVRGIGVGTLGVRDATTAASVGVVDAVAVGPEVRFFTFGDLAKSPPLRPHAEDPVTAVAFSEDGRLLATGSKGGRFAVWKVPPDRELAYSATCPVAERFQGGQAGGPPVLSVEFSRDEALLVVGDERSVRVVDAKTADVRLRVESDRKLTCCALADNRTQVVAGCEDGSVLAWDVTALDWKPSPPRIVGTRASGVASLRRCAAPDGERLHATAEDGTLRVFAATGAALDVVRPTADGWRALALAPDGSSVVRGDGRRVRLERRPAGDVAWTVDLADLREGAFSADARHVAVADREVLHVLDAADGRLVARERRPCAWWGAPGLFDAYFSRGPLTWIAADGKPRAVLPADDTFREVACSADGSVGVAYATAEGLVVHRGGQLDRVVRVDPKDWSGSISCFVASDDGTRAAVGSSEGDVVVYDLAEKKRVAAFRDVTTSRVGALTFLDGGRIASGSSDSTVVVWDPKLLPKGR